jgi:hypothetical protein
MIEKGSQSCMLDEAGRRLIGVSSVDVPPPTRKRISSGARRRVKGATAA